jgi:3-oxoacyl-[acyl-carrier protein] reductase
MIRCTPESFKAIANRYEQRLSDVNQASRNTYLPTGGGYKEVDKGNNGATRFCGQVALVVGGAQGIGKAIAVRLGREGAHVFIADIDRPTMDATVREMCIEGSDVRANECDVRSISQVQATVQQLLEWHGRIDILMYVAGVAPAVPFMDISRETWDKTIETNLSGAFHVCKAVIPHMVARKYGKLVFMASTNSWDGEAHYVHYNASKAGLYLFAKTLAREFGPCGINSNALGPGLIKTRLSEAVLKDEKFRKKYDGAGGLIPLGRIGTPEDVAGPALFLASDDASYINGVLLFVDGGQLA